MSVDVTSVTLQVYVDGDPVQAIEASSSLGVDQDHGEATITVASLSGIAERQTVQIWAGFDGDTARIFNGEVVGRGWSINGRPQIYCQDILARLKRKWGGEERVYAGQTDYATVQNLVEASGVDSSLTSIEGSGTLLGVAQEIVLKPGDAPLQLIRAIDEASGLYKTFTRANGAVYRRPVVLGTSAKTFSQGDNILDGSRRSDATNVVNSVIVRGLEYQAILIEATAQASSPYVPYPFDYNSQTITTNLIETTEDAETVAAYVLAQLNGLANDISLTVIGDAGIDPGATATVIADRLGIYSATDLYMAGVTHQVGKTFTTTVRLRSLAGSGL